jgi:hypothetical protein
MTPTGTIAGSASRAAEAQPLSRLCLNIRDRRFAEEARGAVTVEHSGKVI